VHFNCIDSLIEARLKANKAKTTSDLSSADDHISARKTRFRSSVVSDPPNYHSDENNSDSTGRLYILNLFFLILYMYIYFQLMMKTEILCIMAMTAKIIINIYF